LVLWNPHLHKFIIEIPDNVLLGRPLIAQTQLCEKNIVVRFGTGDRGRSPLQDGIGNVKPKMSIRKHPKKRENMANGKFGLNNEKRSVPNLRL
jgi:hypothetical protein